MGYRKKDPSILEMAIKSSWKFSAIAATVILLFSYALLPIIFSSSKVLRAVIPSFQFLSLLIACLFGIIAVIKLFSSWFEDNERESQLEDLEKFVAAKRLNQKPSANRKKINSREEPSINPSNLKSYLDTQQLNEAVVIEEAEISIDQRWTLELINSLDWKRFEELCGFYHDEIGIKNQQTSLGEDGGIDLILFENNSDEPAAIVQCKKWSNPVGVRNLREFLGVMQHNKVGRGIYVTSDTFNDKAIVFARENNIELVDGVGLLSKIKVLSVNAQERIYNKVISGDFTIPTCVKCGAKMSLKKSGERQFWGCSRYPKCRSTLNIKSQSKRTPSKSNLLY